MVVRSSHGPAICESQASLRRPASRRSSLALFPVRVEQFALPVTPENRLRWVFVSKGHRCQPAGPGSSGLVHRLADDAGLHESAAAWAATIASRAPVAPQSVKKAIVEARGLPFRDAIRVEGRLSARPQRARKLVA